MKGIAIAIFLFALFYSDAEMVKKFGNEYEGSSMIGVITLLSLITFWITLFTEKNT